MVEKTQLREAFELMGHRFGFTRDVIDHLVVRAHPRVVRPDRVLVGCGNWKRPVVFLVDGAARLEMHDAAARTLIVSLIPAGRFIVPGRCIPDGGIPCIRAVAHVESAVAILETATLAAALVRLPAVCLLRLMSDTWRDVSRRLLERCQQALLPLAERLASQLDSLAVEFGRPVDDGVEIVLPLTHTHLARLVGGSRAAVCRALHQLARMGRVAVVGKRFVLPAAHEVHRQAG